MPDAHGEGRARRAYQWMRDLAAAGPVHLLVVGETDPAPIPVDVAFLAASVSVGSAQRGGHWTVTLLSLLFPFLTPWLRKGMDGWLNPRLTLKDCLSPRLADAPLTRVVVFRLYMHDIARVSLPDRTTRRRTSVDWDLDLDDLESAANLSLAGLYCRHGRWRELVTPLARALQYIVLERRLLPEYRRVYLAAWEDQAALARRVGSGRVQIMPNRIAACPEAETRSPAEDIPRSNALCTFLFVGGFGYLPNEDAALWIAQTLCPRLRSTLKCPFRVLIVGRGAGPRLRAALNAVSEIDFRGEVAHMAPLYRETQVALVPIRAGGGTKFKTLEAFCQRCPLVAFPHAVRGLSATDGVHFLAANDGPAFAQACARLIGDPGLRGRIADAAYELLSGRFLLPAAQAGTPRPPEKPSPGLIH